MQLHDKLCSWMTLTFASLSTIKNWYIQIMSTPCARRHLKYFSTFHIINACTFSKSASVCMCVCVWVCMNAVRIALKLRARRLGTQAGVKLWDCNFTDCCWHDMCCHFARESGEKVWKLPNNNPCANWCYWLYCNKYFIDCCLGSWMLAWICFILPHATRRSIVAHKDVCVLLWGRCANRFATAYQHLVKKLKQFTD